MKNKRLSNEKHIARFCGGSKVKPDGSLSGSAFTLREGEAFLSVNCLEFLGNQREEQIKALRDCLQNKGRTLTSTGVLAVSHVGTLIDHVEGRSTDRRLLEVLHEPEDNDKSHSGIHGFKLDDDLIADCIAEVFTEMHPSKE